MRKDGKMKRRGEKKGKEEEEEKVDRDVPSLPLEKKISKTKKVCVISANSKKISIFC
jgi:hypothetical protein